MVIKYNEGHAEYCSSTACKKHSRGLLERQTCFEITSVGLSKDSWQEGGGDVEKLSCQFPHATGSRL